MKHPHFGFARMESKKDSPGSPVCAAGIVHKLLAGAVAELGQVRGSIPEHEARPAADLQVLVTLQDVKQLGYVATHAEALVQGSVKQSQLVLLGYALVLARVLRPAAAGSVGLAVKDVAPKRVPFLRHGGAHLVGQTHGR